MKKFFAALLQHALAWFGWLLAFVFWIILELYQWSEKIKQKNKPKHDPRTGTSPTNEGVQPRPQQP